jgi:hypothetical protein
MKTAKHMIYAWGLITLLALTAATAVRAADAPAAGLPVVVQPSGPAWPDKIVESVSYNNVPLSEVVKNMQDMFGSGFDVVLPTHWEGDGDVIMPKNWLDTPITLQLKHVTAVEIFTAMNLFFQVNETSLTWELTANGSRPVAVLHVTVPPKAPSDQVEQPLLGRQVFFVGDLLGDGNTTGMTMDDVVRTVDEVYMMSFNQPADKVIQASKEGQLIVVTGTGPEIGFVDNTLSVLKLKVELQRAKNAPAATPGPLAVVLPTPPPGAAKSP